MHYAHFGEPYKKMINMITNILFLTALVSDVCLIIFWVFRKEFYLEDFWVGVRRGYENLIGK